MRRERFEQIFDAHLRIVGENARNYGWDELHYAYAQKLGIVGTGWPAEVTPRR